MEEEVGADEGNGGEIKGVGLPVAKECDEGIAGSAISFGGGIEDLLNARGGGEAAQADINRANSLSQDLVGAQRTAISIGVKTVEAAPAPGHRARDEVGV